MVMISVGLYLSIMRGLVSVCPGDYSKTVGQNIIIFGRWTPLGLGMCLLGFLRNSGNVRNFPHPTPKNYFCSTVVQKQLCESITSA